MNSRICTPRCWRSPNLKETKRQNGRFTMPMRERRFMHSSTRSSLIIRAPPERPMPTMCVPSAATPRKKNHLTAVRWFFFRGVAADGTHIVGIGLSGGARIIKELLVELCMNLLYLIGMVKRPFCLFVSFRFGDLQHLGVHILE